MYNGHDGGDWGAGHWVAMAFMMLVFLGIVAAVLVALLRRPTHPIGEPPRPSHHDAERILGERFARGEIDESEFTSRRDTLRRGH